MLIRSRKNRVCTPSERDLARQQAVLLELAQSESHERYPNKGFDDVELDLSRDWEQEKGESRLPWEVAKPAFDDQRLA